MISLLVKIPEGEYSNDDAINRLIGYISTDNNRPVPIGGYGFYPVNVETAIESFNAIDSKMKDLRPCNRKVWHLIVSIKESMADYMALYIADLIALGFSMSGYCVFYGLHNLDKHDKERNYHLHFCIQCHSYSPYKPNLSMKKFFKILDLIINQAFTSSLYKIKVEVASNVPDIR